MNTLEHINFEGKRALLRVDFNVPLNEHKEVTDVTRIVASKPTIEYILNNGGRCILMSHLGRPKGMDSNLSLSLIRAEVEKILGRPVSFVSQCIGEEVTQASKNLKQGEILLLENVRFYKEETDGDEAFAKRLASLADCYVNDAFGSAHRAHASTTTVAQFFDKKSKCLGKLLQKEVEVIDKVLKKGESPVLAILGGAKISSKITVIENILPLIDNLIIGGGMAYTFVKARGGSVGSSICEDDYLEYTKALIEKCKVQNVHIYLPEDVLIADAFSNDATKKRCAIDEIPEGWQGLDAGEKSVELFKKVILESKTILWNGPLGVFEMGHFRAGTIALGEAIAESTKKGAFSLVGGGDSVAAAKQLGFDTKVSYVSTGGGAMLECLEGKDLPGLVALKN